MNHPHENDDDGGPEFATVIIATVGLGGLAFLLSFLLQTPLGPQASLDPNAFLIGVIATLPPVAFLWWFSNTDNAVFAAFRRSQIEFFAKMDMAFTPPRIVLMAITAGVAEEMLFRGVLQTWLANHLPLAIALLLSSAVFGLLHMRTLLYAVIAGVIGLYLGIIFVLTENLLAPMTAHALYDYAALEYTRRAVAQHRA